MSVYQFGQVSIASKDFYKHKQVTDLTRLIMPELWYQMP